MKTNIPSISFFNDNNDINILDSCNFLYRLIPNVN